MVWNIRLLRRVTPARVSALEKTAAPVPQLPPSVRGQLLGVFRRLAAILQMTAHVAQSTGKSEHHAALAARLAIFRARVQAGDTGAALATGLADFGEEFASFISIELGCGRA
jgi:hypothetical protein